MRYNYEKFGFLVLFTILMVLYFYRTWYPKTVPNLSLRPWPGNTNTIPVLEKSNQENLLKTEVSETPYSKHSTTSQGFVMALGYSDQMTGSSANLMNLQCFIGRHVKGVKVIEPFIDPKGSLLGVSLSPTYTMTLGYDCKLEDINSVKLSDIFDFNKWQQHAISKNYSPLVSWNDFEKNCPKKLVLVFHRFHAKLHCDQATMMVNATREFVLEHKFEVIRNVCVDFRKAGALSPREFVKKIYGDLEPSESLVVFNRWGGLSGSSIEDFRYSVKGTSCNRGSEIRLYHHSKQVSNDAKEYIARYMNNTEHYVAAMVRIEYFGINHNMRKLPPESQRSKLSQCFNQINEKVKVLKKERAINNTLLTMDIGKHGTIPFRISKKVFGQKFGPVLNTTVLYQTTDDFFDLLFNHSMTQKIWEESYDDVAKFHIPGYIAIMQKALAANSVCLVLVGGGSFQSSAVQLYNELHDADSRCVYHVC